MSDNTQAIQQVETGQLVSLEQSVASPEALTRIAENIKHYVKANKLTVKIQGKDYVMQTGWQFAAASLGLVPKVKRPQRVERDGEVAYDCECDLIRVETGQVVGYGYAFCSNKEGSKKAFAEYAIASMAQTRATAKAVRNTLAFIMNASGFEATPAEEMDEVEYRAAPKPAKPVPTQVEQLKKTPEQIEADICRGLDQPEIDAETKEKVLSAVLDADGDAYKLQRILARVVEIVKQRRAELEEAEEVTPEVDPRELK